MFEPLPAKFDFPAAEKHVLEFWEKHGIFQKSLDQRADAPRFVFYEGPPTANGVPHPGHCLTRAIKDLFPRYRTMCGCRVDRKAGWDTHGLPVEVEVCKELGIHSKKEIERYGVERFIRRCIESVFRYTREWEEMTRRLGFWVNLEDAYVTYHQSYVESVWWSLKTLFERGLLYQGHKIVWWWCQGGTALSAGEVGEGYRTVEDPAVYVRFPLVGSTGVPPVREGRALHDVFQRELGSTGVPPVREGHPPERESESHRPTDVHEQLVQRRRILPHWEAGGSTYFMTFRLHAGELSPEERTLVLDACRHFDAERYLLHAAVVMPDHVHLLWTPLERVTGEWWSIADLMHSIKSFTAKAINAARGTTGIVWQREYYDRIIRDRADFDEKWNYIIENPARRGLPDTYKWIWVEPSHEAPRRDAVAPTESVLNSNRRDADAPRVSLLVWTTTPWTLVSNHFAAVGPDIDYALVHDKTSNEYLYIAAALVNTVAERVKHQLEVVSMCKGTDLVGQRYVPPFDCYASQPVYEWAGVKIEPPIKMADLEFPVADRVERVDTGTFQDVLRKTWRVGTTEYRPVGWRVVPGHFVTLDAGTGLVHEAPAYGEVDFDLWREENENLLFGLPLLNAVAPDGTFTDDAPPQYRGRWVKDCDDEIMRELKERGVLYHKEMYQHEYPFCPRAEDDPLIQYARKSWFVRTSQLKEEFLKNNAGINWLPEHIRAGRFGDFLRNNVDWALSRERYWGTPLPIWVCEKTGKMEAIGSYAELLAKPGMQGTEVWEQAKRDNPELPEHLKVHKPYIDAITYDSPFDVEGNEATGQPGNQAKARMRRVPEVIDCWWDAGSMPFAQWGFPHASGSIERFTYSFPADFISEAIDQTRGWFYGLLAISTLLFRHREDAAPRTAEGSAGVSPAQMGSARPTLGISAADYAHGIAGAYPMPYRTCIVLGHVMGEDGLKMSKRTKNYKEPSYIFDTYGADAMRWYFFSAQVPWTSTRFVEANIRDAQREFLVRLYNVFSFFNIYANIDGFDVVRSDTCEVTSEVSAPTSNFELCTFHGTAWRPALARAELDRWIIGELHRTIRFVREKLDAFENYPAAGRVNEFVDALSNWYVRRSRERFWRSETDQDKWDAYNTLYEVLVTLSKLIAPFTPFIAETMYQNLVGSDEATERRSDEGKGPGFGVQGSGAGTSADQSKIQNPKSKMPASVHLCDYPVADESLIDEQLAEEMDLVRQIVSLGRAARTAAKLRVRQPLALAEIILARREHTDWLQAHGALIAEELNIKAVEFSTEADQYVTYQVKPNFQAIGPRYGQLAPKIAAALERVDAAEVRQGLAATGEFWLEVEGHRIHLTEHDVQIRLEARPGWSAAHGRAGVVVVKTELTPELRDEGLTRELVHHVQALRKEQDLPYEARITLYIQGAPKLLDVARRFADAIRHECLATEIKYADPPAGTATKIKMEGQEVQLAIVPPPSSGPR